MSKNNKSMQLAVESALAGVNSDEGGPFGACIVKNNEIIAVTHNTVLRDHDPTCHAEMNAIRMASQVLGTHVLTGCEIYSTAEPCPMCLAAIYWARIDKLYSGVGKEVAAQYGFDDSEFYKQILLAPDKRQVPSEIGVLGQDCEQVFAHWKQLGRRLY